METYQRRVGCDIKMSGKIEEIKKNMETAYNTLVEKLERSVIPDHSEGLLALIKALKAQVNFLDKRVEALEITISYLMKAYEKETKIIEESLKRM